MDALTRGTLRLKAAATQVEVTPEELAALNQHGEHEWLVRMAELANNNVDRDFERFSLEVLGDFARTLPGKALLVGHSHDSLGEGIWFRATVEQRVDGSHGLMAAFAVPVLDDDRNRAVRGRIESGLARYVSIGFRAGWLKCDVCGSHMWGSECNHWPGDRLTDGRVVSGTWQGPGEALEGSLVYLGAQYGAELKAPANTASRELSCIGRHCVKGAISGGLALDEQALAIAAVRIAGARGSDGLTDDQRAEAWLEVQRSYAALGKSAPTWRPGAKFEWAQFSQADRLAWDTNELTTEVPRMAQDLSGRLKGACAHLQESSGSLPPATAAALAQLAEQIQPLLGAGETTATKGGREFSQRNRDELGRLAQMLLDAGSSIVQMLEREQAAGSDEEAAKSAPADEPDDDGQGLTDALLAKLAERPAAPTTARTAPLAGLLSSGQEGH